MRQRVANLCQPFTNRHGLLLAAVVFLVYAWFYNGANVNQAARFDVAFAFVEPGTPYTGTFKINEFVLRMEDGKIIGNTIDWARNAKKGPDYYSNKAPLPSLLAIPVYAALFYAQRIFGLDPTEPHLTYLNSYLINLCVTILPMALSAVFAYALALTFLGGRRFLAFLICIGLYFGTLAFPFSTQFWGHTLGLACCVVGAYFAFADESDDGPLLSGLFFGLSVLCDYTCGIAVIAVGIWFVCKSGKRTIRYAVGGMPAMIVYLVYHKICFDSFLIPASSFSNPLFIDTEGIGGLFRLASALDALQGLTVSPYRGLFWYMPCLLAIVWILFRWNRIVRKDVVLLSAGAALAYLVLNVTFNGWHGGYSSGPRYQIVALVWYFSMIACGVFAGSEPGRDRLLPVVKWVCIGLLTISIANMFIIATVSPMAAELSKSPSPLERRIWANPLFTFYRAFLKGFSQISSTTLYPMRPEEQLGQSYRYKSFTFGGLIGLPVKVQVLPPVLILLAGIGLAYRWREREQASGADQMTRANDDGNEAASEEPAKN